MKRKILISILFMMLVGGFISGCGKSSNTSGSNNESYSSQLTTSDLFTDRDLKQTIDTATATNYTVKDNENINITEEGGYVISGSASNVSIMVNSDDESKVQLVLKDLSITNSSSPCIYVKNADKVFVTTSGTNTLIVNGTFTSDGTTNTDAVIFSKDDLVLNGTGTLNITSSDNGITSKDDLKITGGTINITCDSDCLEANNSIAINDGNITINSKKDGLHAEYDEDDSLGYIYIAGGTLNINASDDGIHGTTIVQIDGGDITVKAKEGIEGTYIQINDGNISINATDDGINAGAKSKSISTPTIEVNGGNIKINMGSGDTDAVDSNGNIYVNGGTLDITAQSPFDYDGEGKYNGGKIIVNGTETNELSNQMMGGRGGQNNRGNRR